jgi:hypothetical protein
MRHNQNDRLLTNGHLDLSIGPLTRHRGEWLAAILLLCAAISFFYFSVLRLDYSKTSMLDLGPYPDAVEYFAQAEAMIEHGSPQIRIGYDWLPSRYPPGYSLLMLPWLKVLPKTEKILAPFRTNQTIGLLLLVSTFVAYVYLKGPMTAGLASLLLATLPAFVTYCRSSISDISASALTVLAFLFAHLGLARQKRWPIYLAAGLLGLSLNIRSQLILFGPLLIAMPLLTLKTSRLRWVLHCFGVIAIFAIASSPLFIFNARQFGSPLATGYQFWLPAVYQSASQFSVHHIAKHAQMFWTECTLKPRDFCVADLFGSGTYFTPAFVILLAFGLALLRPTRFTFSAGLAGLTFFGVTMTFAFVDLRLYLPLLILLVAVAVLPIDWAIDQLVRRGRIVLAVCVVIIFGAACAGYPSQSGYLLERGHWQAWDALHLRYTEGLPVAYRVQKAFVQTIGQEPAIVLSDIDPAYLNALLPKGFVAAPIDEDHHYQFSSFWRYGKSEVASLVRRGLANHLPVYALAASPSEIASEVSRLPNIEGYQWVAVTVSNPSAAVAKLLPSQNQ